METVPGRDLERLREDLPPDCLETGSHRIGGSSGDAVGAGRADDLPGHTLPHRCACLSLRCTGYRGARRAGARAQAVTPTSGQLIGATPCAKGSRGADRTCRVAFGLRRPWDAALQPGSTMGVPITPDVAAVAAEIRVHSGPGRARAAHVRPDGHPARQPNHRCYPTLLVWRRRSWAAQVP